MMIMGVEIHDAVEMWSPVYSGLQVRLGEGRVMAKSGVGIEEAMLSRVTSLLTANYHHRPKKCRGDRMVPPRRVYR